MTPEGRIKKRVKEFLNAQRPHCLYQMAVPGGFGVSGWPDFIGCYCGRFFAIETKAGGKAMTALQAHISARIVDAGGKFWLIDESNIAQLPVLFLTWASNAEEKTQCE